MSQYQNFPKDFCERSRHALSKCYNLARKENVEVTLMLAIASSGFVLAFERLRDPKNFFGNAKDLYPEAWEKFDQFLHKPFLQPCSIAIEGVWEFARGCQPNERPWSNNGTLAGAHVVLSETPMNYVLDLIRNSLAHGNVETFPNDKSDIQTIVFSVWSRKNGEYDKSKRDLLAVSPEDFKKFLCRWLDFLGSLDFTAKQGDLE